MQKLENSARRRFVQFLESFKFICFYAHDSRLKTKYLFQCLIDSTWFVWPVHAPPDVVNCEPAPYSLYSTAIHLNDFVMNG